MLRKGPEDVPGSVLVLYYSVGLLILATFVSEILAQPADSTNTLLSLVASFVGYLLYWIVLSSTGLQRRFVPTVACIMACGSILTILMVAAFVMLKPFLGASLASIIAWLILVWSVPVKGHIIARAIERHWYVGIAIALTIFVLQYLFFLAMTGRDTI
jgi:hypothetical protein